VRAFLADAHYGPHRAAAYALILDVASVLVLLLPDEWGIIGAPAGFALAGVWAVIALFRFRRQAISWRRSE
jgi:hypothetical protein